MRQTPHSVLSSHKIRFTDQNDYTNAVVFNWTKETIIVPPTKAVAFVMEPLEIRKICDRETLKKERYANVCRIYTPNHQDVELFGSKHRFLHSQILLFAQVYNELAKCSAKTKRMSAVVSFKRLLPIQVKRIRVIEQLLKTNLQIDFFGRDFVKSADKRIRGALPQFQKHLALRPYQFSLAFENSSCPDVLTEKFQDCIVNHTVPITNNIGAQKYFPEYSYYYIDFEQSVEDIVESIRRLYHFEDSRKYDHPLVQAKNKILYGNFSLVENLFKGLTNAL